MLKYLALGALLALGSTRPAAAQTKLKVKATGAPAAPDLSQTYAALIEPVGLRENLTVVASDAFQGRETGQPGQKLAAEYLAKQLADLGLRGPVSGSANPYLQPLQLTRHLPLPGGYVQAGGQRYEWLKDWFSYATLPSPFPALTETRPVFVGFGVEQGGYSDYAGLDVKGRDVVAIIGEPQDAKGRHTLPAAGRPATYWNTGLRKAALAKAKGARSLFLMVPASTADFEQQMARSYIDDLKEPALSLDEPGPAVVDTVREGLPAHFGMYFVSQELGLGLLGATMRGLFEYIAGQAKPSAYEPPVSHVLLPQTQQPVATENVLGYLEGTDKKDEVLVISAHYDHLGVKHDTIYNGADDDGSGTVAVLALARAFAQAKKDGHGPRRSILFVLMTGEEEGLFGSEYYTAHPVVPLAQTIADLNIDMVGRTDRRRSPKKHFVCVVGSDKLSSDLHRINEQANRTYTHLDLDYRYNVPNEPEQIYYRSDHYNFARRGIPVIFYTTGEHADYHRASDKVDKIEFDKLTERAQLVFHTAWELANREARIVVDSHKP